MKPIIPIFSYQIGNFSLDITQGIIIEWIIILILGIGAFLLTRNLKLRPNKSQAALEKLYTSLRDFIVNTMGEENKSFVPYIGTLMIYLLLLNLTGLLGFRPPTSDLSITTSFAITTFLVVNLNAIRKNGLIGFGKGLLHPFWPMLPLNLLERFILPLSLALRLFGNMVAAVILVDLVYEGLDSISVFAQIGFPVVVHGYFDLFDGLIQMIVFSMLTMINIKVTAEE